MTAFSTELKRAMTARGITQTGLATRADYGRSPLARVIAGETLPTPEVAERLADALDWPGLLAKIVPSRSGTCELCGGSFVVAPRGHSRRFCGQRCKRASHARRSRDRFRERALTETRLTKKRLTDHQEAVLAFCLDCTLGEGVCRDDGCKLRDVSPLRFIPLHRSGRRVA